LEAEWDLAQSDHINNFAVTSTAQHNQPTMMNRKFMRKNFRRGSTKAFTLIELLVVIALTVILLTVLFAPLIQAFQFTEQAQATAEAQDAARQTTEELTRELGSAAGVRDTTGNYLDLPLLTKTGQQVIARAYNAYIDIIPPKAVGSIIDPTVDRSTPTANPGGTATSITNLNQELSSPTVNLPLSAGSTVIRYFIGMRYPIDPAYTPGTWSLNAATGAYTYTVGTTADAIFGGGTGSNTAPGDPQPYNNQFEGLTVATSALLHSSYSVKNGLNNTYQLYRVNFEPYTLTGGSYGPNINLLPIEGSNNPSQPVSTTNPPVVIYDDPDFFRVVDVGETDYVPGQLDSGIYNAQTAAQHNDRVYNWFKIAKQVISTRDVDLVGLPRAGKNIVFDSNGNPVDAYMTDPGTTAQIPVVRTTVNFAPALISNDPMAASSNSNLSQGYGEDPASDTTLPYVPTLFQTQYGNWQGTPAITITKQSQTLQTRQFTANDASSYTLGTPNYSNGAATSPAINDFVLADVTSGAPGTPVYDITIGAPILPSSGTAPSYDAVLLDYNRGEVNFALPALPVQTSGATPPANPYFTVNATAGAYNNYSGGPYPNVLNLGDFNLLDETPLPPPSTESKSGPNTSAAVPNATIVVNSERVVGPDLAAGIIGSSAATIDQVQYTRVPFGTTPTQADTYEIDYSQNNITFAASYVPSSVQVAFNYQNNLTLSKSGVWSATDTVRASYYTSAIMRLNLGIRVYGSAQGNSEYFSLNSQVGVGNSKAN
jgi:type II secretory pathway pseudopilin PulG